MVEFFRWLAGYDNWLQGLGLLCASVGCVVTAYGLRLALYGYLHAREFGGPLHVEIAYGHVVSQATMLWVQLSFATISVMVLALPDLPVAMYTAPEARFVLIVVFGRKILRLVMILVLMAASVFKMKERRRVERLSERIRVG